MNTNKIQLYKCPHCGKPTIRPTEWAQWECKNCRYYFKVKTILEYNEQL